MLDRIIAHTPLGPEPLLFRSLEGTEALSTPFDFSIELLSKMPASTARLCSANP